MCMYLFSIVFFYEVIKKIFASGKGVSKFYFCRMFIQFVFLVVVTIKGDEGRISSFVVNILATALFKYVVPEAD